MKWLNRIFNTKQNWKMSKRFKEQMLKGNVMCLRGKSLNVKIHNIRDNAVQLKITITDNEKHTLVFLKVKEYLEIGEQVSVIGIDNAFKCKIL